MQAVPTIQELRAAIRAAGNVSDLAEKAGVSAKTLYRIVNCRQEAVTLATLSKLVAVLPRKKRPRKKAEAPPVESTAGA